jgi:hypothetical protein
VLLQDLYSSNIVMDNGTTVAKDMNMYPSMKK